ncbi:MAG: class I SAM-dependent methyltransferase [Planctomycetota bacterium]
MSGAGQEPGASYRHARERFGSEWGAERYAAKLVGTRRDAREKRCILTALRGVPAGGRVLDLPCGTGRLTHALVDRGFVVTGADSSAAMVERAGREWRQACADSPERAERARFDVQDVVGTGYGDGEFDAVVCNRLFHHFNEPETRRTALRELGRICSGPVVVSFFNRFALDSWRRRVGDLLRRRRRTDRVAIPLRRLVSEAEAAGLRLERTLATRWAISPQWYAVFHARSRATPTVGPT